MMEGITEGCQLGMMELMKKYAHIDLASFS